MRGILWGRSRMPGATTSCLGPFALTSGARSRSCRSPLRRSGTDGIDATTATPGAGAWVGSRGLEARRDLYI